MSTRLHWDDLKIVLALARRGSVRGAARLLEVSHTTVTRRLDQIEATLESRLFDRLPGGYRPTEIGERVCQAGERIEREAAGLERSVLGRDARLSGEIKITMPDLFASDLLMPDLRDFLERYPEIDLDIVASYERLDLSRREADLALRMTRTGKSPEGALVGRKVATLVHGIYATPEYLQGHRLDGSDPTAAWVGWQDAEPFPQWIRETPYPKVPSRGHYRDAHVHRAATLAGMGIAMLPCFFAEQRPGLVRVDDSEYHYYEAWLLTHPDLKSTARLRTLRSWLAEAFERHRPLLEGRAGESASGPAAARAQG